MGDREPGAGVIFFLLFLLLLFLGDSKLLCNVGCVSSE